jgi:tetratricopeptide (TPR) repeat protein
MSWFTSLFGSKTKPHKQEPTTFTLRQGKVVPVDNAFQAWTSGDLNQMLKAVSTKTNSIDRHFLLQSIVDQTYSLRNEENYRKICIEYAEKHLQEFPSLAPDLRKKMDGILPRVITFQHYATILTEDEKYEKAISICEKAIEYDLHDNTTSGFEGRIARIRKKAEKENA